MMNERFTANAKHVFANACLLAKEDRDYYLQLQYVFRSLAIPLPSPQEKELAKLWSTTFDLPHCINKSQLQLFPVSKIDLPWDCGPPDPASYSVSDELVPTPQARKFPELCLREALSLGNNYISPLHMAFAFVRLGQTKPWDAVFSAKTLLVEEARTHLITLTRIR